MVIQENQTEALTPLLPSMFLPQKLTPILSFLRAFLALPLLSPGWAPLTPTAVLGLALRPFLSKPSSEPLLPHLPPPQLFPPGPV